MAFERTASPGVRLVPNGAELHIAKRRTTVELLLESQAMRADMAALRQQNEQFVGAELDTRGRGLTACRGQRGRCEYECGTDSP